MDVTTKAGTLFGNDPPHMDKTLLHDLTLAKPCVSTNLENALHQAREYLADAVKRKETKYQGFVPRYLLPPYSRCVEVW